MYCYSEINLPQVLRLRNDYEIRSWDYYLADTLLNVLLLEPSKDRRSSGTFGFGSLFRSFKGESIQEL